MSRNVASLLLAFTAAAAAAADWPHFRGPGRDGISAETGWNVQALKTPKTAWSAKIGIGYSGPAVVGDAVYVMGHEGGSEHVRRLDAKTGNVVWTHSYPGALIDNLNAGGPGATPSVDGDRVYTVGREGQTYCLNAADGSVVWNLELRERYGVKTPAWGFTASALVLGDKAVVDAGGLVALDKASGAEIWRSTPHATSYGTPTPFALAGRTYLAHLNNDGLVVVDAADGREAAFVAYESQFDTAAASPIVRGDLIWISVGYDGSCALFRFTGSGLEEVYRNKAIKAHFSTPVLIDRNVYGIDGQTNNSRTCTLVCLDFATGKVAWEQRGGGFGSLTAADGKLLYLNDRGQAAVIPASPKAFRVLSTGKVLDGQCWTAPVLANGRLYCRNSEGTLVAVEMGK